MYCHSCGAVATAGLNYCKFCGANMISPQNQIETQGAPPKLGNTIFPIAAFGLFSIGALVAGLVAMTALRASSDVIGLTAFVGFSTVFGVIMLLIRLMTRLAGIPPKRFSPRALRQAAPNEFDRPRVSAPQAPVTSVTENTTRNFHQLSSKEPSHS